MGRIIKALILGWIGKKIYDRVSAEPKEEVPERPKARAQPAAKSAAGHRTSKPRKKAA